MGAPRVLTLLELNRASLARQGLLERLTVLPFAPLAKEAVRGRMEEAGGLIRFLDPEAKSYEVRVG